MSVLLSLNLSENRLTGPIPRNGALQKFGSSSFSVKFKISRFEATCHSGYCSCYCNCYWCFDRNYIAGQEILDWGRRYCIALGTARGLAYLHHECQPQILHMNLKSSNILLDNNFEPHVSDYGVSKLLPLFDTHVASRSFYSALGYLAPEAVCQGAPLTDKCDVYSYGMVLLELVTGRLPVVEDGDGLVFLYDFVRAALKPGKAATCIDAKLRNARQSEIMQVFKLGLVCTSQVPCRRPSMAEAVQILEYIKHGTSL